VFVKTPRVTRHKSANVAGLRNYHVRSFNGFDRAVGRLVVGGETRTVYGCERSRKDWFMGLWSSVLIFLAPRLSWYRDNRRIKDIPSRPRNHALV
jgi:hypothetical protein